MTNEDTQVEIERRLKSAVSEIALRHGRRVCPEFKDEVLKACTKILSEYPLDLGIPEIVADPIQQEDGSVKFWVGGLPALKLLPDDSSEEE